MSIYTTTADRVAGRAGRGVFARRLYRGRHRAAGGVLGTVRDLALVGAAGVTVAGALIMAASEPATGADGAVVDCTPIVVDESGDWNADGNAGEIAALRGMGWRGDPSDGMEAVYPPECLPLP